MRISYFLYRQTTFDDSTAIETSETLPRNDGKVYRINQVAH